MLTETWLTKYGRLWRSFVKVRQVVEDTDTDDDIDARDALTRFCLDAFELRDWIVKSDVDAMVKDAVTMLFGKPSNRPEKRIAATSVALAACADIANASKHYELTHPSHSEGVYAEVTYEHMSSVIELPKFAQAILGPRVPRFGDHQWMWLITINGVEHDALLLAEDAMRDWEQCLLGFGLVTPES